MPVTIRRAERADASTLLELIRALAEYERLEPPDAEACDRLREDAFGPTPRFQAFLAEIDGEPVGYAIVFETYSSFLARPTLYLEDVFVRPEHRGRGAGRALLQHLAAQAVRRGCGRMEWVVLDWNELAQGFFAQIGARVLEEWRICRMTAEGLRRVAALPADGGGCRPETRRSLGFGQDATE